MVWTSLAVSAFPIVTPRPVYSVRPVSVYLPSAIAPPATFGASVATCTAVTVGPSSTRVLQGGGGVEPVQVLSPRSAAPPPHARGHKVARLPRDHAAIPIAAGET